MSEDPETNGGEQADGNPSQPEGQPDQTEQPQPTEGDASAGDEASE